MKKIYYWSPCLSKVGTTNSTINSAIAMSKYYKSEYKISIINSCGKWENYKKNFLSNGIEVIDFKYKFFNLLPKKRYLGSRLSYIIIFLTCFFPLLNLLKKNKPDFIILHLITSLPLFLLTICKFQTKFILRISGYPKLNFIRKYFWKKLSKKIYKITFPTKDLILQIKKKFIFEENKMFFLPDAVIKVRDFLIKSNPVNFDQNLSCFKKKFFISAGRLTKQKNFFYLINEFSKFAEINHEYNLLIFGNGEDEKKLNQLIINKNLTNRIFLMGFSKDIYFFMKKSEAFILPSLWEEPGFVIVEAAMCNSFVISSNCKNGPQEFLKNGEGGFLFQSNIKGVLTEKLFEFINSKDNLFNKKLVAKKNCNNYTMFRHCLKLQEILQNINI